MSTPSIVIAKIKSRRGSDAARKQVIYDEGELVSTVDTKRLFIGTGTLSGGFVIGSKIHNPVNHYNTLSTVNAQIGDLINANGKFYELTSVDYSNLSSWTDVSARLNSLNFEYDASNQITLKSESVTASQLDQSTVSNGLKIDGGILQTKFNTSQLELAGTDLGIKADGITEREIKSSALGKGLSGGSLEKLTLDINTDHFYFDGDTLSLSTQPADITFDDLLEPWFGDGLIYDAPGTVIETVLTNVDGVSIIKDVGGVISIKDNATVGSSEWPSLSVDTYGRVTHHTSSIFSTLTGNSSLGAFNNMNTLSSIFNGSPSHTLSGAVPGIELTNFSAVDSSGATVSLSSAGFITFEGGITTRNGQSVGRFAIPIFAY